MILGMDWLSKYEGNIECTSKSILLPMPEGRRIKYVSRHVPKRTQVNSLTGVVQEEVPVVKDFPDIFPKELQGMPPDRDIEFFIELLPGTGPISKRPYRMLAKDLEEIKKQIKELLDKVYISHYPRRKEDQVCIPACTEEDSSKFLIRNCTGGSTSGEGLPRLISKGVTRHATRSRH